MRFLTKITTALLMGVMLYACTGTVDDDSLPILTVNNSEIDIAKGEEAIFAVSYNGVDVTAESILKTADGTVRNTVFAPDAIGTYEFTAEYSGKVSNMVAVKVTDTTPVVTESKFNRQVCVVEMTGAWCINCPEGYNLMYEKFSLPSNRKYKSLVNICAFHSDLEGFDSLAIAATQDLVQRYQVRDYPSFITDFRTKGVLTSEGINEFIPSIKSSLEEYPAHCGVAVSSKMNADKTQSEITVKVTSELTSEYRVVVLVVQNVIKGYQKTTLYPEGWDEYIHNHVVRKVVTTYSKTFTGETFASDALIRAGEEKTKSWTIDVDKSWVPENTQIYAIVLDADGYANNMNLCDIDGGDSGYDLI